MTTGHDHIRDSDRERLSARLETASGADREIDGMISDLLQVERADFTSDAAECRRLCDKVFPNAELRVGYDVLGVLPSASVNCGSTRSYAVAPTVPLAILRALIAVIGERDQV